MLGVKDAVIFIVNYNGVTLLKDLFYKCLDSFIRELESSSSVDLWFIDNGSTDSSLEKVRAYYQNKFRYLRLSRNLGYGAACNIAYEYTKRLGLRYKYYICSNNDIVIYPGRLSLLLWWLNLIETKYPGGFIAAPFLINGYDGFIDLGGFFVDEAGGTWPLRLVLLSGDRAEEMLKKPIPVSYSDGAFLITHRKVIEDIGWFDSRFFLYYEDVELSLRAWRCGFPSLLIPLVLGMHYRSSTTEAASVRTIYFNIRNRVFSTMQYIGIFSLLKLVLWYLSYFTRIPEIENDERLQNLMTKIMPGTIVSDPTRAPLLSLLRYATRALIDGIGLASRKRDYQRGKEVKKPLLLYISITNMFIQKKMIKAMQEQIKNYILYLKSRKRFNDT